jgi:hypothetical protein
MFVLVSIGVFCERIMYQEAEARKPDTVSGPSPEQRQTRMCPLECYNGWLLR